MGKIGVSREEYNSRRLSLESSLPARERLRLSNEGLKEMAKTVWEKIKAAFKWIWEKLKELGRKIASFFGLNKKKAMEKADDALENIDIVEKINEEIDKIKIDNQKQIFENALYQITNSKGYAENPGKYTEKLKQLLEDAKEAVNNPDKLPSIRTKDDDDDKDNGNKPGPTSTKELPTDVIIKEYATKVNNNGAAQLGYYCAGLIFGKKPLEHAMYTAFETLPEISKKIAEALKADLDDGVVSQNLRSKLKPLAASPLRALLESKVSVKGGEIVIKNSVLLGFNTNTKIDVHVLDDESNIVTGEIPYNQLKDFNFKVNDNLSDVKNLLNEYKKTLNNYSNDCPKTIKALEDSIGSALKEIEKKNPDTEATQYPKNTIKAANIGLSNMVTATKLLKEFDQYLHTYSALITVLESRDKN